MLTDAKVALVTGGAKRIGKACVEAFFDKGYSVIIHFHHSQSEAMELANTLNHIRPNSAKILQSDLSCINDFDALNHFYNQAISAFGRVDILVHNASSFYPTASTNLRERQDFAILHQHWEDLFLTNAKAPLFISQAFYPELVKNHGNIVSILDIHAKDKPFLGYPIYNMAKSAHHMMVQSLALEFAPDIRVNGVSPGVNIFPDNNSNASLNDSTKTELETSIPLSKIGKPCDIADAVVFLAESNYITGQVLAVDGGRSLTLKGG